MNTMDIQLIFSHNKIFKKILLNNIHLTINDKCIRIVIEEEKKSNINTCQLFDELKLIGEKYQLKDVYLYTRSLLINKKIDRFNLCLHESSEKFHKDELEITIFISTK